MWKNRAMEHNFSQMFKLNIKNLSMEEINYLQGKWKAFNIYKFNTSINY